MIAFTDATFPSQVLESSQPTLVDFWASWCGPCKILEPILDELSQKYTEHLTIGKVEIDANPQTVENNFIKQIPTLILFKDGKEVERMIGARPAMEIENMILKHL
ncbi:MAG: thioredoxin [Bacteroidota bacterium]